MRLLLIPLLVVACLIALPYVVAPVALRMKFRHFHEPEVIAAQAEEVPESVRAVVARVAEPLVATGFEQIAWARIVAVDGVETWVGHFRHRGREDLALATVGLVGGRVRMECLEFRTAWSGGKQYLTNNYSEVPPFGPVRGQAVVTMPGLRDVDLLYRIHHARVRHDGPMASPQIPIHDDGLDVVRSTLGDWVEAQRLRRNFTASSDPRFDRLTWLGAWRAATRQLPPLRMLLMRRIRQRGGRVVQALDLEDAAAQLEHGPLEDTVQTEPA